MELEKYCRDGDLIALQTYCTLANVTAAQVHGSYALREACLNGHLEIARWLQCTFQLTTADMHVEIECALRGACSNGHLDVARWLQQTFQLTAHDTRANNNWALRGTCENGHLEVASWLQQTFQLTAADARANGNIALCGACKYNHLGILRWLQRTWGISPKALATVRRIPKSVACATYLQSLRALRWSPRTHAEFPLATRRLALLLLLIYQRLTREPSEPGALPLLPPELWHHLLSYLPAW